MNKNPFSAIVSVAQTRPESDNNKSDESPAFLSGAVAVHQQTKLKLLFMGDPPFTFENIAAVIMAATLAFVTPIIHFVVLSMVLVAADVISGLRAAVKRKETVTPGRLKQTLDKFIYYSATILLSHGMDIVFWPSGNYLTYCIACFICMVEFKSNIRNASEITGIDITGYLKAFFKEKLKGVSSPPKD